MSQPIGIRDIVGYVPPGRVNADALKDVFKVEQAFLERKTGSLSLARAASDETTTDMSCTVVERLLSEHPALRSRIGLLVVVTQSPDDFGLPHVSARVQGRLGLPTSLAAFDIGLACSGWVYALSVCRAFMLAEDIEHGILVTCDPYSKILNPRDRDTGLLFGDAATATYLSAASFNWSVGKGVYGSDGAAGDALRRSVDGMLHMNGRRVFEFSATVVPNAVEEALIRNGLLKKDIDLFLMHQGSRYIVDTIGERIGEPERTPYVASQVGNTVSSTIPLALSTLGKSSVRRVLVAGFGVGLSWAANVLEKVSDQRSGD